MDQGFRDDWDDALNHLEKKGATANNEDCIQSQPEIQVSPENVSYSRDNLPFRMLAPAQGTRPPNITQQ